MMERVPRVPAWQLVKHTYKEREVGNATDETTVERRHLSLLPEGLCFNDGVSK